METPILLLAGGFGSRIKHLLSEVPKPMAPVLGKPFLEYQIRYLQKIGFRNFYLSTGYLSDVIIDYFQKNPIDGNISYIVEKEPLGTGGAIKYALQHINSSDFYCMNADTLFLADFNDFSYQIAISAYSAAIGLMRQDDVSRYGRVETSGDAIVKFHEKDQNFKEPALINTGIYYFQKSRLLTLNFPDKCSLEQDIFPQLVKDRLGYWITTAAFIDIGTPETLAEIENFVTKNKLV